MAPCSDAMIQDVLLIKPDQTVAEAMEIFKREDIRSLPVVDDSGKLMGLFGLRHVLLKSLPTSAVMQDGLPRLDFLIGATPGMAKRYRKVLSMKVEDVMDKNPMAVSKDTATPEAVRLMALHGSPLCLVDPATGKLDGMISRQSLLIELERMLKEMDEEEKRV